MAKVASPMPNASQAPRKNFRTSRLLLLQAVEIRYLAKIQILLSCRARFNKIQSQQAQCLHRLPPSSASGNLEKYLSFELETSDWLRKQWEIGCSTLAATTFDQGKEAE
jgi:hypothetical protein